MALLGRESERTARTSGEARSGLLLQSPTLADTGVADAIRVCNCNEPGVLGHPEPHKCSVRVVFFTASSQQELGARKRRDSASDVFHCPSWRLSVP